MTNKTILKSLSANETIDCDSPLSQIMLKNYPSKNHTSLNQNSRDVRSIAEILSEMGLILKKQSA
jgi:hypothetical protein